MYQTGELGVCVRRGEWGLKLAQGVILQPVALIDRVDT